MWLLVFILTPCLVYARPQSPQAPTQTQTAESTPIPIINAASDVGEDGSFNYSYETGNGIHYQQTAYTKRIPAIAAQASDGQQADAVDQIVQVMTGSFSYPAPDGTLINLSYIADENGFQPQGDHLPTPPPIPESVQRLLASLPQQHTDPPPGQQQQ